MTNFQGFNTPDGFTQIPNEYLEYTYSHECDLTLVDMKIMNLFFRNTFGWFGKQQYGIILSLTDIQIIINQKNKNQVSGSLQKLVEKNFLQKKAVSELTKKQKSNIEKSLDKKLKSNQVIYRLKLKDNPLPWDVIVNVETQIGKKKIEELREGFHTSIKSDTGIKIDTDTSIKIDTGSSNQIDTSATVEPLETLRVSDSLNKGLNKGLNKKEEEEKTSLSHSELISFLLSKDITIENAIKFETRLLEERLSGFTRDQVLKAIEWSLQQFIDGKCDEPYIYAVGRLQRMLDGKVKEVSNKQKRKPRKSKPIRTEILPEWFKESSLITDEPKKKSKEEIEQSKQEIEDLLKKLRS